MTTSKGDGTTVRVVIEYKFKINDPKAASLIAEVVRNHGSSMASDNWSLWDFEPLEVVLEADVE